jgi:hypothetical protein
MRGAMALLLALVLAACTDAVWTVPVVPPAPPPAPAPVDPVTPPTQVATHEAVRSLQNGATLDEVTAHLGFQHVLGARQDDGTMIARWPAVNAEGAPRWVDVVFGADGGLKGYALLPRAQ